MEFRLFGEAEKKKYRDDILAMMKEADGDFLPPLSTRTSSVQKGFAKQDHRVQNGIELYFEEMNRQEILGAFEGEELMGFVSYRMDHTNDVIGTDTLPNLYLSTLILKNEAKGKGLTVRMYEHLFFSLYPERNLYTRTWSTNVPHIKILNKFSFTELVRLAGDRGEGIDTVYFEKRR